MTDRKATLTIDGETPIELPVLKGTRGQDVIGSLIVPKSRFTGLLLSTADSTLNVMIRIDGAGFSWSHFKGE